VKLSIIFSFLARTLFESNMQGQLKQIIASIYDFAAHQFFTFVLKLSFLVGLDLLVFVVITETVVMLK